MHLRQVQTAAGIDDSSFSFPEVADYRAQAKTIDQFVEFGDWTFNVLGRGEPHRATGGLVTANFFQMLGARPQVGRMLVPTDEAKGAPPVAVLTDAYWRRIFGSDPAVIGQTLDLTVKKAQIVGVLAPGAHYATQRKQDFYVNYEANDHYMSASMQGAAASHDRRLRASRAGRHARAAQAELRQIATSCTRRTRRRIRQRAVFDVVVTPWKDELTVRARPTLMILLVTTIFVLIIACANVGNLTLTRLVHRESEMSIRAALGAPAGSSAGSCSRRISCCRSVAPCSARAGRRRTQPADRVHARFTSRAGEIGLDGRGPRLHDDRRDRDRAPLRVGAAPVVHERSGARDGGARRPFDAEASAAARRNACWWSASSRVVHAADRRGTADAKALAALCGRSGLRSRRTC